MSSFVFIKNKKGEDDFSEKLYKQFEVPEEVYVYIKQLEFCINWPQDSKLRELYPERFKQTSEEYGKISDIVETEWTRGWEEDQCRRNIQS